ncbi:MAG: hypothetical protein ACJ77K_16445 [Bacteroidia bacterium]
MRRKFYTTVLLFSCCLSPCFTQTAQVSKFGFFTAPLSILNDWNGPNLNLTGEIYLTPKYALSLTAATCQPFMSFYGALEWKNIEGGFGRVEIRRHFPGSNVKHSTDSPYLGAEFMGGQQTYTRTDKIDVPLDTTYTLTYDNKRTFGCFIVNLGDEFEFDSHFTIGINAGLGVRFSRIENQLTYEQANGRELGDWTVPANYIQKKGFTVFPRIQMGLRIGFRFGKKIDI